MLQNVAFVVLDRFPSFEFGVVCEVFGIDRTDDGLPRYDFAVVAGEQGPLRSEHGLALTDAHGLDRLAEADLVVMSAIDQQLREGVPGEFPADLLEALRATVARGTRVLSVCTGAFVLAAAGLLDGRRATTHWQHAATLARAYPAVDVEPDAIFVEDGAVFSSAGVSAGIDLALALVERDHGPALARDVARSLVVFLQRPGGQSQFSPSLRAPLPRTPPLRAVCDAVTADPAGDYTLASLAKIAAVSPRHLTRLFQEELRTTPAKYVELIRLSTAKDLLDAGQPVTDTAYRSGFGSAESMRRTFIARLGVSPRAYQQRFRSAIRGSLPADRRGRGRLGAGVRAVGVGGDRTVSADGDLQAAADTRDLHGDGVAGFQRADAGRGAGGDDVAGLEGGHP